MFPIVISAYIIGGKLVGSISSFVVYISAVSILISLQEINPVLPLEDRLTACSIFMLLMTLTVLFISAVIDERLSALASVEETVNLRTQKLQEALQSLQEAKIVTEQMSKQKSEFLVIR